MPQERENIYQKYRRLAGITQEYAAELLDISVESVRAYENGYRLPPNDLVAKMVDAYDAPQQLAMEHLRADKLTCGYLPATMPATLTEAALRFLRGYNTVGDTIAKLIAITCDNRVDADEAAVWRQIVHEVKELHEAALGLVELGAQCSERENEKTAVKTA